MVVKLTPTIGNLPPCEQDLSPDYNHLVKSHTYAHHSVTVNTEFLTVYVIFYNEAIHVSLHKSVTISAIFEYEQSTFGVKQDTILLPQ